MKFICLSDLHLSSENPTARLDDLVEVQFAKLEFVLNLAKKENAAILQSGDISHKPRSWMLLPTIIDLLKKYGVDIYCCRGQHDDYFYSEETRDRTNLGILEKVGLVIPLYPDKPTMVHGVALYGANFGQNLGKVPRKAFTVGVVHASVSNAPLWPGHQYTDAAKFLDDNPDYDFILVGDIHRKFLVEASGRRCLVNTGPMLRREATEYNFQHKPSVYLLNTDDPRGCRWIEIPHAEADSILSRDHIERKEEAEMLLGDFVAAIGAEDVDMGVSFIDNLMKFVKENKIGQEVMDLIAKFIERKSKEGL